MLPVLNPPPRLLGAHTLGGTWTLQEMQQRLGVQKGGAPTLPTLEFPTVSAPPATPGCDASAASAISRRSPIAARARRRQRLRWRAARSGPRGLALATPGRSRSAPSPARCSRCTPARAAGPASRHGRPPSPRAPRSPSAAGHRASAPPATSPLRSPGRGRLGLVSREEGACAPQWREAAYPGSPAAGRRERGEEGWPGETPGSYVG